MRERLRRVSTSLLDLLLPPHCAACGRAGPRTPLCVSCERALPRRAGDVRPPPGLEGLAASFEYRAEVEAWIQRFKYPASGLGGLDPAPRAVVEALARESASAASDRLPELVLPVPLHPRRLRARGFNPAGLLAQAVARSHELPCDPVALQRVRDTPSQTGLDRRARRRNVREAFTARRPGPARVWLVDDVATTGSTLTACARALRAAGAREIIGICAATAPLRSEP